MELIDPPSRYRVTVRPRSRVAPRAARDGMPSPQVSSGTEPVTMKSCTAPNLGQLFTAGSYWPNPTTADAALSP
jgi:hypothetical protein